MSMTPYTSVCGPPPALLDAPCDDQEMRLPQLSNWPVADADVPVPLSLFTPETRQRIRELLSFDNPEFFKAMNNGVSVVGVPAKIYAYQKHARFYSLPRHAPFRRLGLREPRPYFPPTEKLPWVFTQTLREGQHEAFAALRHQLIYKKDGILVLGCGFGKTILGIAAFGWQQCPTLAIVTQLFIAQQWKEALLKFTDIPEDRIGLIGDGHNEWDRDFVIATVQSLATKDDLPPEFYRRFGLVMFDEVHRLGSPLFSKVVPVFSGVRIGLTATLERPDGMHKLFMLHVGKPFFEDKKQELTPRVYFVPTPVIKDVKGFRQWGQRGRLNIAKIITHISRLDYRQEFVLKMIQEAQGKDRKTLVLSERKDELQLLQKALGDTLAGVCVGSLNGKKMSQAVRDKALDKLVILATSQLCKEGLDKPDIDTLICEFPQSSEAFTEQSAGRILRVNDEKRPPVIVILVDSGVHVTNNDGNMYRPFLEKAKKMAATFRRLGYEIVQEV